MDTSIRNPSNTISFPRASLTPTSLPFPSSNSMGFEDTPPFSLPSTPSNLTLENRTQPFCRSLDPVSMNYNCTTSSLSVDDCTELLCADMDDPVFTTLASAESRCNSYFLLGAVAVAVAFAFAVAGYRTSRIHRRDHHGPVQPTEQDERKNQIAKTVQAPMTPLEREQTRELELLRSNYEKKIVFRMGKHEEEKRAQLLDHTNEALKDDKEIKDEYEALDKKYREKKQEIDENKAKKKQERVQKQTAEAEGMAGDHRAELQGPTEEYEAAQLEIMQKHAKQTGSLTKMKTRLTSTRAELRERRAFMRSEEELRQQVFSAAAQFAANSPSLPEADDDADDTDDDENEAQGTPGQ